MMGYSTQQYKQQAQERRWRINPVWRGIGCFLIILIPIMAWFAATLVMQSGLQIIPSTELNKPVTINYVKIAQIDRIIKDINNYAVENNLVTGQFIYTVILIFLGFGILSIVYAVLYSIAGPPRYGPFDVPPDMMR